MGKLPMIPPLMLEPDPQALEKLKSVFAGRENVAWVKDELSPRTWRDGAYEYTIWGETLGAKFTSQYGWTFTNIVGLLIPKYLSGLQWSGPQGHPD